MSKDDYARAVIAEGQRRNITPRGIVIALATCCVESNLTMYANAKVPASMNIPHDAVGSDGYSVGLFQQQVRNTGNGWWWGDAATCMDPTKSAGLFYDRLTKLNYNGPNTPGSYAQAVQGSAFPDRYDTRMADAQKIYDRLATGAQPVTDPNRPDFNEINRIGEENGTHSSIRSQLPKNLFLHTQQGNGNADDLFNFLMSTSGTAAVSYHTLISEDKNDHGVTVVDCVDTDRYSWSVLNANVFSINYCFAGSFAEATRDEWLKNYRNAIRVAAWLAVQDCKKYPTIAAQVIMPPYANHGSGISDHRFVTNALGIGNHTDVGGPLAAPWAGFPWDVFAADVQTFLAPVVTGPNTPPPAVDTTPLFAYPSTDVMVREVWEQLRGPQAKGWPQLDGKTVVDYLPTLKAGAK